MCLYSISLSNCTKIARNLNLKYPAFIFNKVSFKALDIVMLFIKRNAIKRITDFT